MFFKEFFYFIPEFYHVFGFPEAVSFIGFEYIFNIITPFLEGVIDHIGLFLLYDRILCALRDE